MTKKFFDMIGYDPAAVQGEELTDVFDTAQVVAARQEYETAVATYETQRDEQKQDFVEFYIPDEEYLRWLGGGGGRGSLFPGVRFPTLADMAEQDLGRMLTVPFHYAAERRRLGGNIFENQWSKYEPEDAELETLIQKYNIDAGRSNVWELFNATSKEDLEARALVVGRRQARENQIALDSPGVGGFALRMGVNVFDPVMLIGGQTASSIATKAVLNSTTKTGAALRFANDGLKRSEAFKIGAVATLAADVPLELASSTYDVDKDPATTLAFMALAPLVGGAFNTLGRSLDDNKELSAAIALDEAIAKGIAPDNFKGTDAGAGGAAQRGAVPMTVDEDGIPGAPPRSSSWTFGTPLNFLARSADPITRLVAGRLSNNPWTGGSKGTTAFEAQRRIYNAQSVVIRDLRMAAKEYFGKGVTSPTTAQLDDFFKQVGQHIVEYDVSANPAVIRAADALRPYYKHGAGYLQDPNYLPGRELPSSGPTAPSGGPPATPAPKAPDAPEPATTASPEAPGSITQAAPDAPEPISAPEAPTAASAAPETAAPAPRAVSNIVRGVETQFGKGDAEWRKVADVKDAMRAAGFPEDQIDDALRAAYRNGEINIDTWADQGSLTDADRAAAFKMGGEFSARVDRISINSKAAPAPDATGINPEAPKGTARDYFGRKSFRAGAPAKAPEVAPVGATSRVPDEGVVEAPKPTDRVPPTIKTVDEKIAQVKAATQQVIEAAPEGPPSRTDLRRALQGYVEAAEAIAFAKPDANTAIIDAAAQIRRYIAGASAGTNKTFYAKYLDGLQRLSRALEDVDDDAADKLLASVVDDLDNGFGSKLPKGDDVLASRAGGLERSAEAEQVRAERAELYDALQAAFSFGQGPYKKPSIGATAAVGGAGAAAAAAAVAIYEDAPDEVKAGITALAAGIGLAAGAAVGKGRVRKWEKNTPSLGIFAGPTAKGVSLKDLQKAQKMEKAGTDRDVIWKETGWGRMGPAGEWITEIRDPMAGLNDMLTDLKVRLGEVLDAPKIMRAYADLHEVRMQTGEMLRFIYDTKADGAANLSNKTLAVRMDVNRAEQLRIAIHEINHLIQGQRKRQVPGSREMDDRADEATAAMQKLLDEYDMWYEDLQQWPRGYKGPEKQETLDRMDELAQQIDELNPASKEYYQYLTLDLEAESRLVETRLGMTANEARARPPWYDLDVEENDLWMARQVGRYAASLGSDLKAFRDQKWWDENVTEVDVDGSPGYRIDNLSKDGDGVVIYFSDIGDGYAERTWDWTSNVDNGQDLEVLSKSPADAARAYAATIAVTERALASGKYKAINVQGLKKANPGKDMSGHEKTIMRTLSLLNQEGYRLSRASWQSKVRVVDEETKNVSMVEVTRSSFVLSKEDIELDEVWKNIMGRKVDIEEVPLAPKREQQIAASRRPTGPRQEAAQAAPEPDDGYRGLEEWRNVAFDQGYQPRQFNQQGWRRVISSAEYRNNPRKLGNRFGDLFLRNDPQRFEELGQRLGISAQEAAWRTGRKYIDTVAELMNGAGVKGPKANRINPADREAAKEIVREMLNKGDPFDDTSEEALELILDIVAPVRKESAESPRARPRMNFKLSKEFDEDIADIFEWNAEKLYVSYSRHISGYAGILRAGYRSVAELNNEIKQIRENAKFDAAGRQNRAEKEANLLEAMRDAILGVPPKEDLARPEWQFVVNQIRRLNFGNLMNNVGFLALSEVAGALTRVNVVKMFTLFPEYQRYIKLARAGDPKAQESIFYMADVTMGHGSAQLRSRVGSVEDRASGEAPSLEDRSDGIKDFIDRGTRKQANAVARFSGMAPIQEWLRMTIVTAEAQDWVKAARNGKPPYEARRMAQMGIDAPMWQRISGELRKWGDINSPDTRRPVPNMDLEAWEDGEALNFFINALDRNANRIVMEGDLGHTALMLRNKPSAALFFQFLNFPLNAFTKHLGFAAKTKDVRAAAEVLTMMMGGAAGYVARTMAQAGVQDTPEERQKILDERLTDAEIGKAMLYYSAHGSVIPNVLDLGLWLGEQGGIPNPIPGYEGETVKPLFGKNIRASGVPGNPITGNPLISRLNQIPQAIGDLATGTPFSEQDVNGAIKALAPFGNHIAVTALLDRMLEFLPDEEDSIEGEVQQ